MIPIFDIKEQQAELREELLEAAARVLDSGQFILGEEVTAFEREFAAWCGAPFGVAVNSGTSALHLALLAAGVQPGDEVITAPFTFVATVASIGYAGARPVLVDIDPHTFTLDPAKLEAAVTARTRAIVPVHLYGQTADMEPIRAVARRHGIAVIEDAAQAHGAAYKGVRAGALGDMACFSFYPTKTLGACGEGGIVLTEDEEAARKCRLLRDWGQEGKYVHLVKGFNYRMTALTAALLRVKLPRLDSWVAARRRHAALYDELLAPAAVCRPAVRGGCEHAYNSYVIRARERDRLASQLRARGVQTAIHYHTAIHRMPAWRDLGYEEGAFPQAERAAEEVLSLPMYPELREEAVRTVAAAVVVLTSSRT